MNINLLDSLESRTTSPICYPYHLHNIWLLKIIGLEKELGVKNEFGWHF